MYMYTMYLKFYTSTFGTISLTTN